MERKEEGEEQGEREREGERERGRKGERERKEIYGTSMSFDFTCLLTWTCLY